MEGDLRTTTFQIADVTKPLAPAGRINVQGTPSCAGRCGCVRPAQSTGRKVKLQRKQDMCSRCGFASGRGRTSRRTTALTWMPCACRVSRRKRTSAHENDLGGPSGEARNAVQMDVCPAGLAGDRDGNARGSERNVYEFDEQEQEGEDDDHAEAGQEKTRVARATRDPGAPTREACDQHMLKHTPMPTAFAANFVSGRARGAKGPTPRTTVPPPRRLAWSSPAARPRPPCPCAGAASCANGRGRTQLLRDAVRTSPGISEVRSMSWALNEPTRLRDSLSSSRRRNTHNQPALRTRAQVQTPSSPMKPKQDISV